MPTPTETAESQAPARSFHLPWPRLVLGVAVPVALFALYYPPIRKHVFDPARPDEHGAAQLLTASVVFFTFVALLGLAIVAQTLFQRWRLGRFADGEASLRDGAFAAVEGHARAEGELLRAPFSGQPCLAYEYEVRVRGAGPEGRSLVGLAGIALAPCVVEGRHGRARLLGWSPLEQGFPVEWFEPGRDKAAGKALEQLRRTRSFERMPLWRALALLGRLVRLQASAPPPFVQDWCFDARGLEAKAQDLRVRERRLPPDTAVGLCGLWSAARGGVYGQVGRVGLELWAGPIQEKRRGMLVKPLGRFVFVLFLAAALHGMVAIVWKSDEDLADMARAQAARGFEDAWQRGDLGAVQAAFLAGADPNRRDHYGNTLLITAALERGPEWVRLLLQAGADPFTTNPAYGRHHDALAAAAMRGREEVVALLREAGAADFRVTERNGRPLPPDGGPPLRAVRAYYQAMVDEDRAALDRLRLDPVEASYTIDWDLWRRVRPFARGSVAGYWNEHAATLSLRAPDAHGRPTAWAYQLAALALPAGGQEWRIEYEWELREPAAPSAP